jgi:hypothetical protein
MSHKAGHIDMALLILQAESLGYKVACDQVKRTQAEADANAASGAGISNSLHLIGLAVDLLLYQAGRYLTASSDYKILGEWWESFGEDHCWGGRFTKQDGNHFSISHNGVK